MSTMIQVTEPTMVLNEEVCKSNIARMAAKAKAANVVFRPHFKTHQSREIGEWFRASGVDKITVSSLNMAMKFAEWGMERYYGRFSGKLSGTRENQRFSS